ncbi:MAG: aldehyde dehydrogenase [Desulfuromonadales bacterium]|nr:aldehyde dehydrogenase [Desulfuromonadales bacterium]
MPAGVFNLVSGSGSMVGERIASHDEVDVVCFTGSTVAGKRVTELAARGVKRIALELGGKSPSVILDDADLKEAVQIAVETAKKFVPGDPLNEKTRLGPLVSKRQYDRVIDYIRRGIQEGASLLLGGEAPAGLQRGFFVQPTLFGRVTPDMTIAREEIFGPVLSIMTYETENEAVALANATPYGLAGGVWSNDAERAMSVARRLRCGQVDINGAPYNNEAPFGGYRQSGHGREMGKYGLEEFLEIKAIQLPQGR